MDMIKFRIILTAIIILLFSFMLPARETINLQNSTIEFSSKKLTVKQALDEITRQSDINIFYGSQEPFLNVSVVFSSRTMTVQKALDEIKSQAPVMVVFNKDHVIVKSKKENTKKLRIHGMVKEAETMENLAGVAIYIKGTTIGTVTDLDGTFSMDLNPGNYQLVCHYMGYQEQQININLSQDVNLNFFLKTQNNRLKEVNITGNITEVKSLESGRPIETIESKVVNRLNTNDVNDALLGRINGVWTTKVSGAPGDHHNIKIRGISSILGSTDPLYVVDGVIIPVVNFKTLGISDLNSHDVNSIAVLKDASSSALFGCLGGNGVVIVETRKGGGRTSFNFNVKKGIQHFEKRYKLMDAETFLSTLDSSDTNNKTYFLKREIVPDGYGRSTIIGVKYPHYSDSLGNTLKSDDFQNELFKTGEISEYQLSGQGAIKKINYYISGNYYDHKGIIVNSNYEKYTLTGNFSRIVGDRMSIRLLYKGSHQNNKNNLDNYMGNNVIFKGINYEPAYRSTPDSCLEAINRLYYNDQTSSSVATLSKTNLSPETLFYGQEKTKVENTNSANLVGFYRLNKAFSLLSTISFSLRDVIYSSYLPHNIIPSQAKFLRSKENIVIINQQYDLNYEKQWKNHGLNAFIRFRNYNDNVYWNIDSLRNVDLDGLTPQSDIYLRGSQAIFGERGSVIRSINSGIFNVNYNYKKKYTISLLANLDQLKEGAYVSETNRYTSV
ncbi:MAG TPA: carboxypeptidase-like regulatory domain-containing protein, partial [Prolixibacteraceae bacterium]|nr:carboxypeptidase-like regulatory domain-containing protein [Prolixibacteraceae bacterium]